MSIPVRGGKATGGAKGPAYMHCPRCKRSMVVAGSYCAACTKERKNEAARQQASRDESPQPDATSTS